jgi:hypothetical protein
MLRIRSVVAMAVVGLVVSGSGCMQYRQTAVGVTPAADCPDMSRGCAKTVWNLVWGLAPLGEPLRPDCGRVGLQEVTVRSSAPLFLVTLVTVGLVSPRRVEWKCAAPAPGGGVIPAPSGAPSGGP